MSCDWETSLVESPDQADVQAQGIDPWIGIGHAEVGVVHKIGGAGERRALAKLLPHSELREPIEGVFLAWPTLDAFGMDVAVPPPSEKNAAVVLLGSHNSIDGAPENPR